MIVETEKLNKKKEKKKRGPKVFITALLYRNVFHFQSIDYGGQMVRKIDCTFSMANK